MGCQTVADRAIQGAQRPLYLPGRRRFERITGISGGEGTSRCTARKRVRFPSCASVPHVLPQEIGDVCYALWSQSIASSVETFVRDAVVERGRACAERADDPGSQADRHDVGLCAALRWHAGGGLLFGDEQGGKTTGIARRFSKRTAEDWRVDRTRRCAAEWFAQPRTDG